jgi:multiple sugar transport system substrate-binding protein
VSPCLRGKNRFQFAFFLLLSASVLASTLSPAHAVEIFFHQRGYVENGTGAATTLTDAAVAAFTRDRPDVRVRVVGVPWGKEGDLKLRTALLARRRIDVFRLAHDQLPGFVPRSGRLLSPIDPYLSDADRADIFPAALDAVSIDGHPMAWPLWSTAVAMIVNEDLLDRAAVAPPPADRPWSWSEFTAALEKLAQLRTPAGDPVAPLNAAARPPLFEWSPLLLAHCGPLFPDPPRDPARDPDALHLAPDLADALDRVRALRAAGLTAPGFGVDDDTAAQQGFLDGRTAVLLSSPGFLRRLQSSGLRFRVLPPPTGDRPRPITTGALGCFAVVQTDDPDRLAAAHALARYLTSSEIAGAVPGWYLAAPARASIETFFDNPAYRPLRPILPTVRYLRAPGRAGFMDRIVIPRLQAALLGQTDPPTAVAEIQAAWRRQSLD